MTATFSPSEDGSLISDVTFTRARPAQVKTGLLGWVQFTIAKRYRIDGVTLYRRGNNCLALSFPSHLDSARVKHFLVEPISEDARREIEDAVFAKIPMREEANR